MQVFQKLLNNVVEVERNLPSIVVGVLQKNHSEEMVDLNVEQLRKGRTNKGELITPELESDLYAQGKKAQGGQAPLGTPDMIDEGNFTGALYTEQRGDAILFDSKDSKSEDLNDKYKGIYGLTKESKSTLFSIAGPQLIKTISNAITK